MLQTRLGASQALLGRGLKQFWTPLGRLLAGFWLLLGSFWTLLNASWPPLGRSWASLGWSEVPLGCILAPQDASGLDFGGLGNVLGWVSECFGGMCWHAFRCACCKSQNTKCSCNSLSQKSFVLPVLNNSCQYWWFLTKRPPPCSPTP